MEYINLGNTGLNVSKLCFGALTISPLQANLSIEEGAEVIAHALKNGINFIDTAELYENYFYIRKAINITGKQPIIATKTYAYDRQKAYASLEKARKEMGVDTIDIFLLHEQESIHTIRGHMEALEFFCEAKQKGLVKAVGVSTHNIEVVKAGAEMKEIDVIHPIVNIKGIGIGDGSIDDMLEAVRYAVSKGKGIYAMKPLGGGNLIKSYEECLNFVLDIPELHSIAIGMQSNEEVDANIDFLNRRAITTEARAMLNKKRRKLHIDSWCENCGKCIERCPVKALRKGTNITEVDMSKCLLCGYCGSVCPAFAIKVI